MIIIDIDKFKLKNNYNIKIVIHLIFDKFSKLL